MDLFSLKAAVDAAEHEVAVAKRKHTEASKALAEAISETLGVKVGSIVETSQYQGYGRNRKKVTRRYRVTSITYKGYGSPPIELWGNTLRQDGTEGVNREIWRDWTAIQEG